jgi:hypothetical protein
VELRTLLRTVPLTTVSDTREIFQHNETIRGETIDEATTNGMQISACPTVFLIAQPCPSAFRSRAFAPQDTPSGTEPLAPLYQLYTRNLDTVRSDQHINLAEVDTDNILRWVACLGFGYGNDDMQIEFSVPMTLENCESGFGISNDWEIASSDFDGTLDSFTVASGNAHPDAVVFQEQSEEMYVQVQRLGFEVQEFQWLLFSFECFVCFSNAAKRTMGVISVEIEPLSDLVVSQMLQSDGMEAPLSERYLTDSVARVSKNTQCSLQPSFVFCRQVKFSDNGQLHRLYYTPHFTLKEN